MIIKIGILNNNKERIFITINNKNNSSMQDKIKIKTAKGEISFDEIVKNTYNPHGFNVDILSNDVIPKIRFTEQQSCFQVIFYKNNFFKYLFIKKQLY